MSCRVSQVQVDRVRYTLDAFYTQAALYSARLAGLGLDEGERQALLDQHRVRALHVTLADLEEMLQWEVVPGATEKACP